MSPAVFIMDVLYPPFQILHTQLSAHYSSAWFLRKRPEKIKETHNFFFLFFFVLDRGVDKKKKSRNTTIQYIWVCCVCMHQEKCRHTRVWSCVLKLYSRD